MVERGPGPGRADEEGSTEGLFPGWRAKLSGFLADTLESLQRLRRRQPQATLAVLALTILYRALYPRLGVLALLAAG
ncbi:MAG: hypothetical protein WA990_15915 [Rubrobacteraceae bacterium]